MHAAVGAVCSAMLHEILFWSRFVCAERRSACACACPFHVFLAHALSRVFVRARARFARERLRSWDGRTVAVAT